MDPSSSQAADHGSSSRSEGAVAHQPVTIYVAASAGDSVQAASTAFRLGNGAMVTTSIGASSALAQQISKGAPADLFLSASPEWGRFLEDKGEVAEQVDLLSNRLVVITPKDNPAGVRTIADLTKPSVRRLALADPGHVPAGQYGREALERLKLWDGLRPRVVAADDVRGALAFVARGEVEAGIVYATDAAAEPGVAVVASFDPALHAPIRYPLILLRRGKPNPTAQALFAYLQTDAAAAVFRRAGFTTLRPVAAAPIAEHVSSVEPDSRWLTRAEWSAIRLSLWVACWAVVISVPPGVALGYWLARRQFPGKAAVETLVNLPLVLPPVVTGYLLLVAFGNRGWIGGMLGVPIAFTWRAAALASAVVSFPLMVRAIRLAFEGVDARLEHAARTLGAGPLDAFWTVSVPLARNGIVAGSVLAFARSLGEFGATIMFAGNVEGETRTVPVAIYTLINQPGGVERSWRLVAISIAIAGAALVFSEVLQRRGPKRESA